MYLLRRIMRETACRTVWRSETRAWHHSIGNQNPTRYDEATRAVEPLGASAEPLRQLARYMAVRTK